MHELPPLIHRTRDRMIDVHHTILPLDRPADARRRGDDRRQRASSTTACASSRPADIVVHAAAHLFADGDLAGGLRNLWDIDRLLREFAARRISGAASTSAPALHQLPARSPAPCASPHRLYATPGRRQASPAAPRLTDRLFEARLLARNGWGQERRKALRFAFYMRSPLAAHAAADAGAASLDQGDTLGPNPSIHLMACP